MGSTVLWLGVFICFLCVLGGVALIGVLPSFALVGILFFLLPIFLLALYVARGAKKDGWNKEQK